MATAAEVDAKNTELQAAVADMDAKGVAFQATRDPFIQARQAYVEAILTVGRIDDELESLTTAYEPPAPPQPE